MDAAGFWVPGGGWSVDVASLGFAFAPLYAALR